MKGVHVVLRWALAGALLVVLGVGVMPTILKETALATPLASCDLPIYQDNLAAGWSDASWNVTYNYTNNTPVYAGSSSIGAMITSGYGALSVLHGSGISSGSYTSVVFWINGGASGSGVRQLQVLVWANASPSGEPPFQINVLPDQWTQVVVPLSAVGSPTMITRISI
jgi:hypothetical protein